jgi:membrane-associated phospholipid phosphatase
MAKVAESEQRQRTGAPLHRARRGPSPAKRVSHQTFADDVGRASGAATWGEPTDNGVSVLTDPHPRYWNEPEQTDANAEARRLGQGLLVSALVFALAFVAAAHPNVFDRPVAIFINGFAGRSIIFDRIASVVYWYPTFTGVILMALVWFSWFEDDDQERRSRILLGTLAAVAAGMLSRFLQHALPTHPRPYYDDVIHFRVPINQDQLLNTWNSFPSDHVTVFVGLVAVLFVARSRFAMPMMIYTAVMELARIYMGAHYPSDLVGGAALAFMCVWAAQLRPMVSAAARAVAWERTSPALFYAAAFFLTYQFASLFTELRSAGSMLAHQVLQG